MLGAPVACGSRSGSTTITAGGGGGRQRTTHPVMTGTTVLGIVYDKGVLLAADTVLSYGSMAKNQNVPRLAKIPHAACLLGASGEYSDFQALQDLLERKALEEESTGLIESTYDPKQLNAWQIWNYLRFVMYNRRNKFNPYWNELVVAGTYRDEADGTTMRPFLGTIDKIGTTIRGESVVATGFGSYLALPLLREQYRPNLTEGEARALLEDAMRVLFFRDCCASARIQLAKAEISNSDSNGGDGTTTQFIVSDPYDLEIPDAAWNSPAFSQIKGNLDDPTACGF
ncbi:hypothetical protein ACA910_006387 [Epithemia clementina (nom. ined.)]